MHERSLIGLDDNLTNIFFEINANSENESDFTVYINFPLPDSLQTFREFQASPAGLSFRDGCESIIDDIHHYVDANELKYEANINLFKSVYIHNMGGDAGVNFINLVLYQQGIPCLARIRLFLHDSTIPEDTKHGILANLLSQLNVCGPGIYKHIVDCYLQLKAVADFKAELQLFRKSVAEQIMILGVQSIRENVHPGMDIHYANAIINHYAAPMGLTEIDDSFIKSCGQQQLSYLYDFFKVKIHKYLTVGHLLDFLLVSLDLQTWVATLIEFQRTNKVTEFNEALIEFERKMTKFGTGTINVNELFIFDEDGYTIKNLKYDAMAIISLNIHTRLINSGYVQPLGWYHYENDFEEDKVEIRYRQLDSLMMGYIVVSGEVRPLLPYCLEVIKSDSPMKYTVCSAVYKNPIAINFLSNYLAKYFHSYEYLNGMVSQDEVDNIISFLDMSNQSGWKTYFELLPITIADRLIEVMLYDKVEIAVINEIKKINQNSKSRDIKYKVIDMLLGYLDPHGSVSKSKNNVLHLVTLVSSFCLVKKFVEMGVDVNKADDAGHLPIHFAVLAGDTEIVSYLIEKGSRIDYLDSEARTPLFLACKKNSKEMVKLLIDAGADVDSVNSEGVSILQAAVAGGSLPIIELLLQAKANPNASIDPNSTPLITAINRYDLNVVMLLINAGASLSIPKKYINELLKMIIDANTPFTMPILAKLLESYKAQLIERLGDGKYATMDKDLIMQAFARIAIPNPTEEQMQLNKIFIKNTKLFIVELLMSMLSLQDGAKLPELPPRTRHHLCWYIRNQSYKISLFMRAYDVATNSNFVPEEDELEVYGVGL